MDTIADVGSSGEFGVRAGRPGCPSSSLERCREAPDRSGELPARGFCVGCGAAQRRERQPGVQLAGAGFASRLAGLAAWCRWLWSPPPLDAAAGDAPAAGRMEIALADGSRVIVDREVDGSALARVLAVLARR